MDRIRKAELYVMCAHYVVNTHLAKGHLEMSPVRVFPGQTLIFSCDDLDSMDRMSRKKASMMVGILICSSTTSPRENFNTSVTIA